MDHMVLMVLYGNHVTLMSAMAELFKDNTYTLPLSFILISLDAGVEDPVQPTWPHHAQRTQENAPTLF